MFQLCYELLSMSYVYDLPKTQNHVAKTLCLAVKFGYDLFNIDDLKNIIPLLKNRRNDKSRSLLFFELCEYLPDELAKKSEICLAENDDMLPFLIHAGMREKSVKNELEEVQKDAKQELEGVQRDFNVVKEELQEAIDRLPSSLFNNLPNTKKMPTDSENRINAAAKWELERIIYWWWGRAGSRVRNTVQVPPSYDH